MKDEAGPDEKILAVPVDKLHPFYSGVRSYKDLPKTLCEQIVHFFQHYKDLEKGKWVTLARWLEHRGGREDDRRRNPARGAARRRRRGALRGRALTRSARETLVRSRRMCQAAGARCGIGTEVSTV